MKRQQLGAFYLALALPTLSIYGISPASRVRTFQEICELGEGRRFFFLAIRTGKLLKVKSFPKK